MFLIVSYCFISLETICLSFSKLTINQILFLNLSSIYHKFNNINELSLTWLTKYLFASKYIKYVFVI